jgi:xylan 1,4-beta-xylosidase
MEDIMIRSLKGFGFIPALALVWAVSASGRTTFSAQTFCNPLNLSYRFSTDAVDAREAADPVMVLFKDDYYLFASRSGGYWYSNDMRDWTLVIPNKEFPVELYAPAVVANGDSMYYNAGQNGTLWVTADPKGGVWKKRSSIGSYGDPDLFIDDDGKWYMYYGLSNSTPTYVVELDPANSFKFKAKAALIAYPMAKEHGWERRGDDNLLDEKPWIEGSWMTKHNGRYYLQYSAPGTEFKTYADGIYVADAPLGPFSYESYSPFSFKPTGFITGAGHGCTFQDKAGRYWRVVTMVDSTARWWFDRRIGLFPVDFDADGIMHTNTEFGDYPQYYPGVRDNPIQENFTGWMLLSRNKRVRASSHYSRYLVQKAVDENVKTYWAAATGDPGEWLQVDLRASCEIHAIQVNFGEEGTTPALVRGRTVPVYEQYTIEISPDSLNWTMLVDKSMNLKDVPHDYIELTEPRTARYVKLTNMFTPGGGKFAVRDLRLFGDVPANPVDRVKVADAVVVRDAADERNAVVKWNPVPGADGYIVRYGLSSNTNKMYNHYMVYDVDSVAIHSLNKGVEYYFEVESFDSGTEYYRGIYSGIDDKGIGETPEGFSLLQNYPNPFNPETSIGYHLPRTSDVRLDVYDLRGGKVREWNTGKQPSGLHMVRFNASALPSGVYVYRLTAGGFTEQKKMVLMK